MLFLPPPCPVGTPSSGENAECRTSFVPLGADILVGQLKTFGSEIIAPPPAKYKVDDDDGTFMYLVLL